MDNKLLFGPEEFYEDSAKDLRAYLEEIWKYWENELDHNFCGSTPSLRHGLYNYFEFIMKTNLRRFIVSYLGIALCKRDTISASNFNETNQITSRFLNESVNYIKLIGKSLHKLTHYLYACPQKAAEKKNNHLNIELEGMIRVRLIEERSLSSSNRPCRHNCDLRSIGNKFNNTQCTKAIDCRYVSSGFDVCQKENSSRRYEWIKDYDGNIYGKSMSIKKNNICQGKITTLNSQYLWYNGYYCDYCVCTCVEKPKRSNHVVTAISFRDQTSDIYNDWVVTGIRFVRKDSLIHLQIQEGLLLPYGKIRTTRWRPLDRFGYNEKNDRYYRVSERDSELGKLVVYLPLRLGRDYGRAETVNLDDVMAPGSHVVTGVRFRFTWDSIWTPKRKRGPIELHIRVTKIDFAGGRLLNHNNSWWITPDYYDSRGELTLKNPDDPRNAPEKGGTVSTATSVRFRASDWMKDAGQSTVPFFDGRETSFTPAAPLQGLGLCHLGHEGFGGYLAFRIFDFDMSSFFFSQFDDPNL